MKKYLSALFVLALVFGMSLPLAFACGGGGSHGCSMGGGRHGGWEMDGSLKAKFFHKAYFLLKSKDQIGLSEDQAASIQSLLLETKKTSIRQKAENEVLKMDIHSKLRDKKADEAEIQKLIDQKYENKKNIDKTYLSAYLKLKSTLNDKQWEAFKNLKKEKMSAAKA